MLQNLLGPVDLTCPEGRLPMLSFSQKFSSSHSLWHQTGRQILHPEFPHSSAEVPKLLVRMYQRLRVSTNGCLMWPCVVPAWHDDVPMFPWQPGILWPVTASQHLLAVVDQCRSCPLPAIVQTPQHRLWASVLKFDVRCQAVTCNQVQETLRVLLSTRSTLLLVHIYISIENLGAA